MFADPRPFQTVVFLGTEVERRCGLLWSLGRMKRDGPFPLS